MFQHVKDRIMSVTNQNPTQDLMPEVLAAFKAIMVAQAQECFYEKASSGMGYCVKLQSCLLS